MFADGLRFSLPQRAALVALLLGTPLLAGCFDEPEIEDRWTRLDLVSANVAQNQVLTPGTRDTFTVRTAITYRSILTGVAVAELRASGTLTAADLALHPDAPRVLMAQNIDSLLQSSVSVGRATRAITGWDHLIQHIDFTFEGWVPASVDTSATPPAGLFLVCYLGAGEEIELPDGSDSLIVTPFGSAQYEVLPVGMELSVGP
ncbi:MAG TPA: hypothetical protein VEY91_13940 [Candidatus Limnocylindria bacterium]|nr:hypothetical protein [Candidatus Limnocylindria bacterium]